MTLSSKIQITVLLTQRKLQTLRNKKQLAAKLGFSSPPINESNRKAQQDLILEAVIKYGLDTVTIEAGMMGSGGRQSFYGNIVDGKFVKKSEENSSLLEATKQKAVLVSSDHQPGQDRYWDMRDLNVAPIIGDEDVEVAFLREQKRRRRS